MDTSPSLQFIDQTITHRPLRDLAWALLHPQLFVNLPTPQDTLSSNVLRPKWTDEHFIDWLQYIDQHPHALLAHLKQQRASRLGIYFEQLLSFYFSEYPRFSLLAKNLQVNNDQRTIGEYDFIIWDNLDQQHYHIEVAVKFYIGIKRIATSIANNTPTHNWHLWVGPNYKDSLGIKMNHLLAHQLQLSDTKAGKAALANLPINSDSIQPQLLLTGCLYYPQHNTDNGVNPPYSSNHQQLSTAIWVNQQDLLEFLTPDSSSGYIVLPRQLWMAALTPADISQYSLTVIDSDKALEKITRTLKEHPAPLHIAQVDNNAIHQSAHKGSIEKQRFFVLA